MSDLSTRPDAALVGFDISFKYSLHSFRHNRCEAWISRHAPLARLGWQVVTLRQKRQHSNPLPFPHPGTVSPGQFHLVAANPPPRPFPDVPDLQQLMTDRRSLALPGSTFVLRLSQVNVLRFLLHVSAAAPHAVLPNLRPNSTSRHGCTLSLARRVQSPLQPHILPRQPRRSFQH